MNTTTNPPHITLHPTNHSENFSYRSRFAYTNRYYFLGGCFLRRNKSGMGKNLRCRGGVGWSESDAKKPKIRKKKNEKEKEGGKIKLIKYVRAPFY